VLSAHLLTILSPLVVIWAVLTFWQMLQDVTAFPVLFLVAASLQILGSVIESAQNHGDDWYLTNNDRSLLDGCFNTCIVASLAFTVLACQGQHVWLWPVCLMGTVVYSLLYWRNLPVTAVQALLGLLSTACLYLSFQDPVVLMPLLAVFLTLYFLNILLCTAAQSLHGFTTIVNGLGLMSIPWAMYNTAQGNALTWFPVLLVMALVVGLALALRPRLLRLEATPRGC
jgi:hypothetical protein